MFFGLLGVVLSAIAMLYGFYIYNYHPDHSRVFPLWFGIFGFKGCMLAFLQLTGKTYKNEIGFILLVMTLVLGFIMIHCFLTGRLDWYEQNKKKKD